MLDNNFRALLILGKYSKLSHIYSWFLSFFLSFFSFLVFKVCVCVRLCVHVPIVAWEVLDPPVTGGCEPSKIGSRNHASILFSRLPDTPLKLPQLTQPPSFTVDAASIPGVFSFLLNPGA